MKFSYLNRRKRKSLTSLEEKNQEVSGSSGIWSSLELTPSGADDRIKKEKEIIELNHEGDFSKFQSKRIKSKLTENKLDYSSLNIGYYILVPLIGGVAIGLLLDNQFKTKPLFTGIFLFFGIVAAFYNLFKLLKNE